MWGGRERSDRPPHPVAARLPSTPPGRCSVPPSTPQEDPSTHPFVSRGVFLWVDGRCAPVHPTRWLFHPYDVPVLGCRPCRWSSSHGRCRSRRLRLQPSWVVVVVVSVTVDGVRLYERGPSLASRRARTSSPSSSPPSATKSRRTGELARDDPVELLRDSEFVRERHRVGGEPRRGEEEAGSRLEGDVPGGGRGKVGG